MSKCHQGNYHIDAKRVKPHSHAFSFIYLIASLTFRMIKEKLTSLTFKQGFSRFKPLLPRTNFSFSDFPAKCEFCLKDVILQKALKSQTNIWHVDQHVQWTLSTLAIEIFGNGDLRSSMNAVFRMPIFYLNVNWEQPQCHESALANLILSPSRFLSNLSITAPCGHLIEIYMV